MKKIVLIILIATILFSSCKQQENSATNGSEIRKDSIFASNFYKRFEGTIAGQPVVMHIHKSKNKFEAIYYYRNTGGWLTLSADNVSADSIYFSEYDAVYNQNTDSDTLHSRLRCRLQNDLLTGVWLSKDKKTSYPINLKETYPRGSYKFSIESYKDSLIAFPDKKDSPFAEIDISFIVSENNDWVNTQIKKILTYDSLINFKEGFTKIKTEYFNDYKKDLPENYDSVDALLPLNYSHSHNISVRYNEKDFVILESKEYNYSGGAHGNYGSYFYCFDVAAKKKLKLRDIISADSVALQHIVEKYFRTQYAVKSALSEVLFENYLAANENFYFNEKGIGFLYNPYEVASYAQGEITIFIPFSALQNFIEPTFKKRLNINF